VVPRPRRRMGAMRPHAVHRRGVCGLDTHRLLVEPACAAALAPLFEPAILAAAGLELATLDGPLVGIVCGGSGVSLAQLAEWKSHVGL
jgi:hypothetical protein